MTDKVKTHYEVEDLPPDDPDTKVALFEQAAETAKDGAAVAEQIRADAEAVLGSIFQAADNAGDTALANRVNDVWEQIQTLTTVAVRQGAALSGANGAIGALKEQRDKVLVELKGIKEALGSYDTDHPELIDYAETLQDMFEESQWDYFDDSSYDIAWENIRDDVLRTLEQTVSMTHIEADKFFNLLVNTPGNLTDEQIDILKHFGATLRDNTPQVAADEEESDE
jgi:hypothetical protein